LALSTKINAVFAIPALLLWILVFCRRIYLLKRLVWLGIIGAITFLVIWPWLYHESLPRLVEYILFVTVDHWKIGQFYLGQLYMPPPWHFSFVMTLAVVPLSVTLLYILGFWRTRIEQHLRPFGGLLALCALVPLVALSIGQSMVYDNERLFMPTFPYLAALAGIGFDWLITGVRRLLGRSSKPVQKLAISTVTGLLFLPHVVLAGNLYPHLLSYYSEAIGGLSGAVRLGLETTYWCETYNKALPYLNAHARPGSTVWVEAWSHDVMFYYQILGRLDPRLQIKWPFNGSSVFENRGVSGHQETLDQADYVVIQYRQTSFDDQIKGLLREKQPVYQLDHQGIPLLEIYAR
jgi:hypothetical protein